MNPISVDLAAVAAAVTAAGVPATADPGRLLQLVASHPAAALVSPPDEVMFKLGMTTVDFDARIAIVTASPDDAAATDRLLTAALTAAPAAVPRGPMERDTQRVGEVDLPCYRWATARRVTHAPVMRRSA